MKTHWQVWRKFVSWSALGALVVAVALCFGLGTTRAATRTRTINTKSHATRRSKTAATYRATLRRASYVSSYKTKTTTHRRRRRWRHHVILPKRPSEQRTEQIQEALERGGYYSGDPNGKWDMGTQASLRRFQEANGLAPTGKLDALTLQKMGLGSDVAGVSAPRAVTPGNSSPSSDTTTVPKTPGQ
jgi:hypothetical protein